MDFKICPAPGCQAQIGGTLLMCQGHWLTVPEDLRGKLLAAWREVHRSRGGRAETAEHQRLSAEAYHHAAIVAMEASRPMVLSATVEGIHYWRADLSPAYSKLSHEARVEAGDLVLLEERPSGLRIYRARPGGR